MNQPSAEPRDIDPKSPLVEAVLDEVMRHSSLHPGFRDTVRQLALQRDDSWQSCCGSDCDPCVLPMQRAVEAVRQRLGFRPAR